MLGPGERDLGLGRDYSARASVQPAMDYAAVFAAQPTAYLVLTPDLVIVEANRAYLTLLGRRRDEIVGRQVFEAFPPSIDTLDEHGRNPVELSFMRCRDTGLVDPMSLQQYAVLDESSGQVVERFWSLISAPVLDADGATCLLLQRVEDVTQYVRERRSRQAELDQGRGRQRQLDAVEADLFARVQELRVAQEARELAARRLSSLAEAALQLGGAETVPELVAVVFSAALPVLGASGGSLAVRSPGSDLLELTVTDSLGVHSQQAYAQLPLDGSLPTSIAARGMLVLVPDPAAAADYPGLPEALRITGTSAWAALPLQIGARVVGALSIGWARPHAFPADELELLRAFAAQCAQVLDRLQVRAAERHTAAEVARISETLQRSLLTDPPPVPGLTIAAHYQPASQLAQVGGDWYDVFPSPDGSTSLVIGDVAGHDRDAAAAMSQVRNLLRGVAQTLEGHPARVLDGLDRALERLQVGVLATLLLCQVSQSEEQRGRGEHAVRWCNAGHPPPLLLRAGGSAELLHRPADLLAGLLPGAGRSDHTVTLFAGDLLLLYTDGLVETRRGDIEDDLSALCRHVAEHADLVTDPQSLLDVLTERVGQRDDDVALLAVQACRTSA